ncbi:MAG: hypothetical protein K5929_09415 [Lachnospiraceae bacterium]|nr:hypothetical protein [Lachnospiraceae bacterium]
MKKAVVMALILGMAVMTVGCGAKNEVKDNTEPAEESGEQGEDTSSEEALTGEEALTAVENYCYEANPDLEGIVEDGEYEVYWDIASEAEDEIVILYHSYTGSLNRYYIDPVSGDTYVTEFVPGITDEEEQTEESFNIFDYLE